jgi:hypothetical protein
MDNNLPESFGRFRAEMDMAQAPKNNLAPLHLHIPEPKFRPGDVADFSDIIVPEVDANPRPDEHVMPADIHPLAYGLVRVLGDDHQASYVSGTAAGENELLHEVLWRGGDIGCDNYGAAFG